MGLLDGEVLERRGVLGHGGDQGLRVDALAVAAGLDGPGLVLLVEDDRCVDRGRPVLGHETLGEGRGRCLVHGHDRIHDVFTRPGRGEHAGEGVVAVDGGLRGGGGIDAHAEFREALSSSWSPAVTVTLHLFAPFGDECGDLLGSLTGHILTEHRGARKCAALELLGVRQRAAGEDDSDDGEDRHQQECHAATAVATGGSGRTAQRGRIGHVRHGNDPFSAAVVTAPAAVCGRAQGSLPVPPCP